MSPTVIEHLEERARSHPTQVALHVRDRAVTFAELSGDSDVLAKGLQSLGIQSGTRTALMVPPGLDFFSLSFALFKVGAVPVLIDPGMGIKNLGKCLAQAEPEAFIGSARAHAARRLFGWAKSSVRITVNAGGWNFFCTASTSAMRRDLTPHPPLRSGERVPEKLCAILFTSGSTGIAKGVEYTHAIFSAQIEMLKATYGIEPGEIDFCTFPLFALFGAALGMTCVVPDMNASQPATIDPAKARTQIRRFRCTNLFGSPAVIKRLANEANPNRDDYSSLRRVISAGAPATASTLERMTKLLPDGVPIYTPYGATECLPVANISSTEILNETRAMTEQGSGVCVGKPVAGMEVMVIPITDDVWASRPCQRSGEAERPPRQSAGVRGAIGQHPTVDTIGSPVIGEFVVRGPVVTSRYFRNPTATALAKISDPATGETLHRMGDVGYIDELGRLWFCGRKSHRVVTQHGTLFTDMVEPVFNTVEGVVRTALVGVNDYDEEKMMAVLCVEVPRKLGRRGWHELTARLRVMADLDPLTAQIELFFQYRGKFPVDVRHNSKIFREKLADWAGLIHCTGLYPEWKP